jgi:hypothetical protein
MTTMKSFLEKIYIKKKTIAKTSKLLEPAWTNRWV